MYLICFSDYILIYYFKVEENVIQNSHLATLLIKFGYYYLLKSSSLAGKGLRLAIGMEMNTGMVLQINIGLGMKPNLPLSLPLRCYKEKMFESSIKMIFDSVRICIYSVY